MPEAPAPDEWDRLIAGVRAGEPAALHAFYERFGPSLERVATKAIAPDLLRRFGPESVANSVCRTFLRRARGDQVQATDADGIWRMLCAIALNKVRERVRYHRRERRRVGGEVDDPGAAAEAPDRGPAAEDLVAFRDQLEHVLATLDDEERRVLELRLGGASEEEVAAAAGCSERTVRRILRRLEARLTAAFG